MSITGSLSGRTVLVPGGTGNVGEGVVRALLSEGAIVIVPSRSQDRLDLLQKLIGPELAEKLICYVAPYESFSEADALATKIFSEVGGVTDVVPLIGGWWGGKALWDITAEDWQKVFVSPATTQMALLRSFFPKLPASGTYTTIAGFSSYQPVPGSGPVSMQGAAQLMMRKALSAEVQSGPRINDVMLGPIINRSRPQGRKDWLDADQVGHVIVKIILTPAVRNSLVDVQEISTYNAFTNS